MQGTRSPTSRCRGAVGSRSGHGDDLGLHRLFAPKSSGYSAGYCSTKSALFEQQAICGTASSEPATKLLRSEACDAEGNPLYSVALFGPVVR
jgi:hypothetical protein